MCSAKKLCANKRRIWIKKKLVVCVCLSFVRSFARVRCVFFLSTLAVLLWSEATTAAVVVLRIGAQTRNMISFSRWRLWIWRTQPIVPCRECRPECDTRLEKRSFSPSLSYTLTRSALCVYLHRNRFRSISLGSTVCLSTHKKMVLIFWFLLENHCEVYLNFMALSADCELCAHSKDLRR